MPRTLRSLSCTFALVALATLALSARPRSARAAAAGADPSAEAAAPARASGAADAAEPGSAATPPPPGAGAGHAHAHAGAKIKALRAEVRELRREMRSLKRDLGKDDKLPFGTYRLSKELFLDFHGYYRARYVRANNIPTGRLDDTGFLASDAHTGRDDASDAHFVFSRLRLDPTLRWGGNPARGVTPSVSLSAQIDLLDNVIYGDNARVGAVPLFASNPSNTNVLGKESPPLLVRRLWVDVQVPIGLMKVGRQASQGGLGLLFNDGNGFRNDFGDALSGSTYDRVAFATRPLTIYNALTNGSRAPTPLIVVVGHDWLVEDPLGFGGSSGDPATRLQSGPLGAQTTPTCGKKQDPTGTEPTEKCDNDVSQWLYALIWKDTDLRINKKNDELLIGLVYVNRTQAFNKSNMHIWDGFWRVRIGLSPSAPSLYSEGEFTTITGRTNGLKLLPGGTFDDTTGLAQKHLEGGVLNWAARLGLTAPAWDGLVEIGSSSGDEQLIGGDQVFKMYPVNADYRMGLLMYPMVLWARSVNTAAGRASSALQSGGSVFNSMYLNPKVRYRLDGVNSQIELIGQGVFAWADTLNGGKALGIDSDYFSPRDTNDPYANNTCKFMDADCNLGWEVDLAVKIKWNRRDLGLGDPRDNYMVRWSNELGFMGAGKALRDRLAKGADFMWTYQSRIAFVW
jgi:hypothetical protein